jgi:TIR domain
MPATFISYRRDDAAGYAGRLHEALERRLGEGQIFRDIDTLEPGFDFVDAIGSRLRECRVFLAIIGREWLDARDAAGQRRLDQSHDYVRLEIAGALARSEVRVIPVLIEGATMPAPEALPENIRALARRHAMNLRDDAWDHDVDRLAGVIADVTKNSTAQPVSTATPPATVKSWFGGPAKAGHSVPRWRLGGAAVAVLGVLIVFLSRENGGEVSPAATDSSTPATDSSSVTAASIPTQRYGVAVPRPAEVAHKLFYTLFSANVTPLGNGTSELRLRVQFANYGRYDANAWDASFRLVVNGQTLAPTGGLNEVVPGRSLRNFFVTFTIPATAMGKAVLRVLDGERVGELPLDLSTTLRPPEDEQAEITDSLAHAIMRSLIADPHVLVRDGDVTVTVLRASSRRFVNVVRVRCALRFANTGQYPSSGATLRLAVGDQMLPPLEPPNVIVEPRSNESADIEFEIPTTATQVVLSGTIGQSSGELPIDVPQ